MKKTKIRVKTKRKKGRLSHESGAKLPKSGEDFVNHNPQTSRKWLLDKLDK